MKTARSNNGYCLLLYLVMFLETATAYADSTPPSIPQGLSAYTVTSNQVDFTWTAANDDIGVTGYSVHRDGIEIGTTSEVFYRDLNLGSERRYCYRVSAYDGAGNDSGYSSELCIKTFSDKLVWKFNTGNKIDHGSPTIGPDGTIYIGNHSGLYAVFPNGTLRWKYLADKEFTTPVIAPDDTIYVQTAADASSNYYQTLYALDSNGNMVWIYQPGQSSDIGSSSPALAEDGTIYIGADTVYAINHNGSLKWQFPATVTAGETPITLRSIRSSPAIGYDGTIIVGANGGGGMTALIAINPDGSSKWAFLLEEAEFVFSSPAVDTDGTIYIGAEQSTGNPLSFVFAVQSDGTLKWKYTVNGTRPVRSSPVIGPDGTIYVGTKASTTQEADLLALNPDDGTLKWNYTVKNDLYHHTPDDIYSSPAVGADGLIYFGAESGRFYALYPDGTLAWAYGVDGAVPYSSPVINYDGTIYIGTLGYLSSDAGHLFALSSSSTGLTDSPWPMFRRDLVRTGRGPLTSNDTDQDRITDDVDTDDDNDGIPDGQDAFPQDYNESIDSDNDGLGDNGDNCPFEANADQADYDNNGIGDACDEEDGFINLLISIIRLKQDQEQAGN